jgi:hypothetical protein
VNLPVTVIEVYFNLGIPLNILNGLTEIRSELYSTNELRVDRKVWKKICFVTGLNMFQADRHFLIK